MADAIHFIQCKFTHRRETSYAWLERDVSRVDRQSLVEDIIAGQIDPDRITLILEVDTDLGTSRDVTADIADQIATEMRRDDIRQDWRLLQFLQEQGALPAELLAAE
jgi:hypothetical protein